MDVDLFFPVKSSLKDAINDEWCFAVQIALKYLILITEYFEKTDFSRV